MANDPQSADRPSGEHPAIAEPNEPALFGDIRDWLREQAPWWIVSCAAHMVALAALLLLGRMIVAKADRGGVGFDAVETVAQSEPPVDPPIDPGPPDPEERGLASVDLTFAGSPANDAGPDIGLASGTLPSADRSALPIGPQAVESTGISIGGSKAGRPFGPPGEFTSRGDRRRQGADGGNTRACDNAVRAALNWFARHQMRGGNWSLQDYTKMCIDRTCTGPGDQESLSAATAMGVLPFLAAGQTHVSDGRYKQTVASAVYWLINHQRADGDLSADANGRQAWMYSHGLASIALSECYAMSHDKNVGRAAQKAVDFIQAAQNLKTGGWRYHPGDDGDTSVFGWQLMALKSAQMAGLSVSPAAFEATAKWLRSIATGTAGGAASGASSSAVSGEFAYQPDALASPTMSAVGLLCSQYLRAGKSDPVIVGGVRYLMANPPDGGSPNVYYWYYASQVMHNMDDHDWDVWNRKMRKILVESQSREGCSAGSWDPDKPNRDAWGAQGGRIMMTSLATLTLEVYYRYMPLYRTDRPEESR